MKKQKILIILGVVSMVAYCVSPFIYSYRHKYDWKKDTTPLPRVTVMTLCKNLSLSDENPLCNGSKDVYAVDFDKVLREYFRPEDEYGAPKSKAATYQDVESAIGKFKWECEPVTHLTKSGYSYFRCLYDFLGDRYWRYAFYFYYPSQTLFSIRSGSIRDD